MVSEVFKGVFRDLAFTGGKIRVTAWDDGEVQITNNVDGEECYGVDVEVLRAVVDAYDREVDGFVKYGSK